MRKMLTLLLSVSISSGCFAQEITTNFVTAAPNFREVSGKLYNIEKSTNWIFVTGNISRILDGGILVNAYREEPERELVPQTMYTPNWNPHGHAAYWRSTGRTNLVDQKTVFLTNFPPNPKPTTGQKIRIKSMRSGVFNYDQDVLELWDAGTLHKVAILKPNATNPPPKPITSK